MSESDVQEFWNSRPCGDHIVGGLHEAFAGEYERFFVAYDATIFSVGWMSER